IIVTKECVFKPGSLKPWLSHCLFSALFISAHRGHLAAVRFLIEKGADVNGHTPTGRCPLHATAAKGHLHCLQELYAAGAHLNLLDCDGHTALDVACLFRQRRSMQQIYNLQWQERAGSVRLKCHLHEIDLFPHQCFDSKLHTWHRGSLSPTQRGLSTLFRLRTMVSDLEVVILILAASHSAANQSSETNSSDVTVRSPNRTPSIP
uniref:Uncharacterized protein n=1 Tax=Pygocentrus nattereri TaxID=42514 RepID=A0AAR2K007_PYGNA